ncbi:hypothetical protein PV05_04152 [Exophiala xenobiotica]|uniref:Type I phosphodiesterase/nucleotide pyrophosphatase n=1 Tax=Exophiala xenobiotica TaxID=348802 RepID=A0A0D2EVJ0_9EURO|nr:uncharacterized protein PV05_04152 [Exophiala xenobiotica]KIW59718.1 hypothetical protein PV05_04152 [Exophiala xenobiotica]
MGLLTKVSLGATAAFSIARVQAAPASNALYKHVLVFSVDGMHSSDVEKYVAVRPESNISKLLSTGYEYSNAFTSAPSDSFPGSIAQYTGGSPRTTGIWYDDVWDWTYYPAGSNCTGVPGAEVQYAENVDYNSTLLWSGGIDPGNLPMTFVNGKCESIYPHMRLQVNTVFEVITAAGLQTAYVDKHPAYEIMNGPSGKGLSAGYFPEIQAVPNNVNATIAYDELHVQAWLSFIDGTTPANSTGHLAPSSMPALIGGNFQAVSVAQKTVGYMNDSSFSPALLHAFDYVDGAFGRIVTKLDQKGQLNESLIIIASKHGQAPINPQLWNEVDPDALVNATGVPTAFLTADDIGLLWLNDTADIPTAVENLHKNASNLKIQTTLSGTQLVAQGFGNPMASSRVPHIIVQPELGTCYTTSQSKLAEHGGLSDDDRKVACFISNPKLQKKVFNGRVNTTQVAPTILKALGLDPKALEAVLQENTQVLYGFQ